MLCRLCCLDLQYCQCEQAEVDYTAEDEPADYQNGYDSLENPWVDLGGEG